jgi:transcriptional regulator with XRE-family HTH domain
MQGETIESIEEFAGFVETRRRSLTISQEGLSDLSSLDRTWISSLETGKKDGITLSSILKLTKALRIKIVLVNEII